MTEAAEGIDYDPRPPGNISKEQQLEIYKNNAPTINRGDDDEDYEQTPEEVQVIIDNLKNELNEQMTDYNKEEVQNQIAEFEDQLKKLKKLKNIDVGGAKKNRKTKSKRKAKRKTNRKTKSKKKTKRKAKGNTKKRR